MAPNLFSLNNILLSSALLFALTAAAPISQILETNCESPIPIRDVWGKLALGPRHSTLDDLRIGIPILPETRAEHSPVSRRSGVWVEEEFDPKSPLGERGLAVVEQQLETRGEGRNLFVRLDDRTENESPQELQSRTAMSIGAKTPVVSRAARVQTSPIGPTESFNGSLWRRTLNRIVAV